MTNGLRTLRKNKNMTLQDLSEKTTMTSSTLSRLELGDQNMYLDQAVELANFFNVSIDDIANREFLHPERTIIKTVDFNLNDMIKKLNTLSDKDLYKLNGVIDFILDSRDNEITNEQKGHRTEKIKY